MSNTAENQLAEEAWNLATAGITGATAEIAAYKPRFVEAVVAGRSLSAIEQDIEEQLSWVEWQWPWFEEWYKTFTEWGTYPPLWPVLQPEADEIEHYTPEELAAYRRAGIGPLMVHAAAMIFYRNRHLSRAHLHQKWRLAPGDSAAEQRVAETHKAAISNSDLSAAPPYFPGDRSSLLPDAPLPKFDPAVLMGR